MLSNKVSFHEFSLTKSCQRCPSYTEQENMLALDREDVWQSLVKHHFLGVFVFRSSNGNISIGISWASFSLFTNALFGCWYPRFCLFCGRLPPLTMFLLITTCSRLVDYWFHKNSSHQIEKRWKFGRTRNVREMFDFEYFQVLTIVSGTRTK